MPKISDTVVIYYSREDNSWIAHTLRTDQIGVGNCVVNALADLMRAIDQLSAEARQDRTMAVRREAPEEVQRMARHSKKLPRELFEIAHKMARGEWPRDLLVDSKPVNKEESLQTELIEESAGA